MEADVGGFWTAEGGGGGDGGDGGGGGGRGGGCAVEERGGVRRLMGGRCGRGGMTRGGGGLVIGLGCVVPWVCVYFHCVEFTFGARGVYHMDASEQTG